MAKDNSGGGALNGDILFTFGGIDGEVLIHRTLPDFIERVLQ